MNPEFPVVLSTETYYSVFNAISVFGGYVSIISALFITIPIALFGNREF